jgi:hypothetical protein
MSHARLAPSARYRWARCPGSVAACSRYETEQANSSPSAVDGTHSHTLLESCLKNTTPPQMYIGAILTDYEGSFAVDQERAQRVAVAWDYIQKRLVELGQATQVLSEQQVSPKVLLGRNDMDGTVDVQLIVKDKFLEIIDYKDGMNPVEAKDNEQLEQYALAIVSEHVKDGEMKLPFETIRMTIVQPKLAFKGMNPISTHDILCSELLTRVMSTIITQAQATDDPAAPLVPGEKQCRYCPHQGNCTPSIEWTLQKGGITFEPTVPAVPTVPIPQQAADNEPETMSDEKLRELVEAAPMLRKMLEAAEDEALRRITSGHPVAGLKAVHGPGRRGWNAPEEIVAKKLAMMHVPKEKVWVTKLVSPAQAEKLTWTNRKNEPKQLTERQLKNLHEMITQSGGSLTVVPESDRREGVNFGNFEQMFQPAPVPTQEEGKPFEYPSWMS